MRVTAAPTRFPTMAKGPTAAVTRIPAVEKHLVATVGPFPAAAMPFPAIEKHATAARMSCRARSAYKKELLPYEAKCHQTEKLRKPRQTIAQNSPGQRPNGVLELRKLRSWSIPGTSLEPPRSLISQTMPF